MAGIREVTSQAKLISGSAQGTHRKTVVQPPSTQDGFGLHQFSVCLNCLPQSWKALTSLISSD